MPYEKNTINHRFTCSWKSQTRQRPKSSNALYGLVIWNLFWPHVKEAGGSRFKWWLRNLSTSSSESSICLALSHYLNHLFWLIVKLNHLEHISVLYESIYNNFNGKENEFEKLACKMAAILSRPQCYQVAPRSFQETMPKSQVLMPLLLVPFGHQQPWK